MDKQAKPVRQHFQSDGNGSLVISKAAMGAITLIILILGTVGGAAAVFASMQADVEHLTENQAFISPAVVAHGSDIEVLKAGFAAIDERTKRIETKLDRLIER